MAPNTTAKDSIGSEDRRRQLQEFDDTKLGVKGLLDSGVKSVPAIFHHPPESLRDIFSPPPQPSSSANGVPVPALPVLDLFVSVDLLVDQVRHAAGTVGFFWLVNHGVPVELMAGVLHGVRRFNEGPVEAKQALYSRDPTRSLRFAANLDLFSSAATDWRDSLYCKVAPERLPLDELPEPLSMMLDYGDAVTKVARRVLQLLSESLGMPSDQLHEMGCMEQLHMVCQYYPPCPEPHRTMGVRSHADTGFVTVLLQDDMGGLQVLVDGSAGRQAWVDVTPLPGALLVNMGTFLEFVTNGRYRSVRHRVPANRSGDKARVLVAVFCNPDERRSERLYGPIPEAGKPLLYRSVIFPEFMGAYSTNSGWSTTTTTTTTTMTTLLRLHCEHMVEKCP